MTQASVKYECPVEGCTHEPFKTVQARSSHIRTQHPEYREEESAESKVPIVEEHFAELLRKFRIRADVAKNISDNISATGGPKAFEDPATLLGRLALWSKEIPAHMRTNIMDQWFAEIGIDIPSEVQTLAGKSPEEIKKAEEKGEGESGAVYVYDIDTRHIRTAKRDETGVTMEEAKELKRMAERDDKEPDESPFIMGPEGNWTLNPKARITGVEYMAFEYMKKGQEKGEPLDPISAMTQAAQTMKLLKEVGGGDGTSQPTWMTDPAAFIEVIQKITGGGKADSALQTELSEMRKTVEEMKDERWQNMFAGMQDQISKLGSLLNDTIKNMSEMQKGQVGRTEMDIIHDIASEGISLLKTEMPGLRKDIKEGLSSSALPPSKTEGQREDRKGQFREALQQDTEIEELGTRLFLK